MDSLIHVMLLSGLFIQSISLEYVLIQQKKTWDEAQAYCRQNHIGNLVTVQNNEDWTNVQRAVQPALTSVFWTGLYNDINGWRWSYQDENMTFLNWYSREPNNNDGKQECAFMSQKTMHDFSCYEKYPFFCYNEQQTGGNRFVIYHFETTWHEAQSYCRQRHTDLATIRNEAENDQLVQMMEGKYRVWIGLYRHSWKWSDGKNVNAFSITWMMHQPDMTGPNRPCGAAGPDGLIDDQLCSDALPFICEIYRKKQIVRLGVKSGLNVNDAAVMETILQYIHRKLKDNGIEKDTTLTWRLQSDGNVFSPKHDCKDAAEEMNLNQEGCSEYYF